MKLPCASFLVAVAGLSTTTRSTTTLAFSSAPLSCTQRQQHQYQQCHSTSLFMAPKKGNKIADEDVERTYFTELMSTLFETKDESKMRRTRNLTELTKKRPSNNLRRKRRRESTETDSDLLVVPRRNPSTSNLASADPPSDVYNAKAFPVATDLINAVLDPKKRTENKTQRIEALIQKLTASFDNLCYDPNQCLYGPLYATMYSYTPDDEDESNVPLWETVSAFRPENLKGQQYWKDGNAERSGSTTGNVLSYSEIWGPTVHLRASGVFEPKEEDPKDGFSNSKKKSWFASFMPANDSANDASSPSYSSSNSKNRRNSRNNDAKSQNSIRTCPDIFKFNVRSASVHAFGSSLGLPVRGSSFFVVLYADPRVRILLSPVANKTSKGSVPGVGDWNPQGLIAVQLRSDLLPIAMTSATNNENNDNGITSEYEVQRGHALDMRR